MYRLGAGGVCEKATSNFSVNEERENLVSPVPAERRDERLVIPGENHPERTEHSVDRCPFVLAGSLRDT